MKKLIVCLIILLATVTVYAQDRVTEDYTHELCQCLIYHAHRITHSEQLDYDGNEEDDDDGTTDIVTMIMDICYPIHFLQVRTYTSSNELAADMMGEEAVENSYEELAEAAVKFVTKGSL